ncbi:MAG: hypothetical protein FWG50_04640 [Kiritimatiellaeota bacterium]|nr:hypothetical protein [Kiritimatiellota bacterium]
MKTTHAICSIMLALCLSAVRVLAHGYHPGRLEDAAAKADQAVLAKITAIKETPIHHTLKDGKQGPLLTTRRDYTLEVSRVLAGVDHKPGAATYTAPSFVAYDENGEMLAGEWVLIDGTGNESHLEQGQEYVLCLRGNWEGSPNIIRAEPVDRAEAVTTAMRRSQCWAALRAALTVEEFKSVRLVAYDSANGTLAAVVPSPGRIDPPRARVYAATPNGTVTCAYEFDTYLNYNHLYFDGTTVILRASNEHTMIFPHNEFAVRTTDKPQ